MVYLDNNATTKLDDEVFETMLPFFKENYGNASSIQHKLGREASHAIEQARQQTCSALGADPKEIIFTSGATEAINMAIKGVASRYQSLGNHIITCQTEHKAVLSTCASLEKKGYRITYLPVDNQGKLDLTQLATSITSETILVCIMLANNETGVIHPVQAIAELCQEKGVLFFCDATQYIGKNGFMDLREIPVDLLCLSAHKFHGPKGIGALYVKRKSKPIQLEPLIIGGNQENGQRGGTYNVTQIVGLGQAIKVALENDPSSVKEQRDYFERTLSESLEDVSINGHATDRLFNTSNITIKHVRSNELMSHIPDVAISSGSACVTGTRDPSHVLKAMGLSDEDAYCSIRVSLSRFTTKDEIDYAVDRIVSASKKIRQESPIWDMYKKGLIS